MCCCFAGDFSNACRYRIVFSAGVEEMNSDDDDDDDAATMVTVQGEQVQYHDVTPAMVQRMTAVEKDEYIRIGQEMYQDMYD